MSMLSARLLSSVLVLAAGGGCLVEPDADPDRGEVAAAATVANVPGVHVERLTVGGLAREVIVYVPAGAAGSTRVPAVLALHGAGDDGEGFLVGSGWREKADAEGMIVVFPSALTYCYVEDENRDGDFEDPGETKVTTRWAAGSLGGPARPQCSTSVLATLEPEARAAADHPLADDIAFMDATGAWLATRYAIDGRRVSATGFADGGAMTARLAVERADRFTALASAAGALEVAPSPAVRPISMALTVGNLDGELNARAGVGALPMTPTLLADVPAVRAMIAPLLGVLELDEQFAYELREVGGVQVALYRFSTSTAGARNSLTFAVIEGLGHQYPNGINHPLSLADPLWRFFSSQR